MVMHPYEKPVAKPYENIIYEKKPPVAYITLNRPEKLNALSRPLQLEMRDAFLDAGWDDDKIRVIVLKGAGRCFSAGFDLSGDGEERDAVEGIRGLAGNHQWWWDVMWTNPKPIIAQVHSFCMAGGMATAQFCDLIYCSEDPLFGYPQIRNGGPYIQAIWPWTLGFRKAKELLFTGNLMDAQTALRVGLVNHVVPRDQLDEVVTKMALTISKVAVFNNEFSKKLVNMSLELMGFPSVLDRSREIEAIGNTSPKSIPELAAYQKIREKEGVTAALMWRKNRFIEEDAWWAGQAGRPATKK